MAGNLGHLAATVSLNIDPFKASARTLSSTIKATTAELKAQDMAFKGSSKSVAGMKTVYGTLERQAKQYEAQLKREKQTLDERTAAVKKGGDDMEKLTTREANAASAYNKTAASIANLNNRMSAMSKQITLQSSGWYKASQGAAKLATVSGKAGKALTSFGSKATMSVTAPLAAGFTMAAKSAIDFNSQIDAIGPLMTNGAAVTGKYKAQLDQLATASKQWSVQYGISTTSINAGLADLIRAGYNAGQSMKMMPAILDASRASGEDFNSVMEVVTSTMTQFGVQAGNTTSVTDAMTYAANATKSGFGDMGEAMQYTGQSAHAAGVSLNETVADIGLLSNAGLQGSMAGTAFNMALQKLAGASTKANSPMAKLGVNIKAFKAGQIGLPEVIDQITKSTSGMSKASKVAAINAAFGERGGRAVLGLVNAGAPAMRKLTAETEKASGATKKVSDMMGNTAKANFDKLKSSIQVLAIEVGENLLPAITPMIEKATDMVKSFGNLDKGTQQSIIKFALLAAAVGPVSSALGGLFNVVKIGSTGFSAVAGGIARASAAAKLGATGFDVLKNGFSKTTFESLKAAGGISKVSEAESVAATGGKGLLAAISPIAPALVGVTAAVAAGYAVWEIWGKKAYESGQRTKTWGTDVGSAADASGKKFQSFETTATTALNNTSGSAKDNANKVKTSFSNMLSEAKRNAIDAAKETKKALDEIGNAAGGDQSSKETKKQTDKAKARRDAAVKDMTSLNNQVQKIYSTGDKLNADQRTQVKNLQNEMASDYVKTLNISQGKQAQMLKALQGNLGKMSESQLNNITSTLGKGINAGYKAEKTALAAQKRLYETGQTTPKFYYKQKRAIEQAYYAENKKSLATWLQTSQKAFEKSDSFQRMDITEKQHYYASLKKNQERSLMSTYDLSKAQADAIIKMSNTSKKSANTTVVSLEGLTKIQKAAAKDWNSLVFDPKTGMMRTNAQEEVNKAVLSGDRWANIALLELKGKMSTNATEMVAKGLIASKQWNNLKWLAKTAHLNDETKVATASALINAGEWNNLSFEDKKLLATDKTNKAVMSALNRVGDWDELTPKQQQLIAQNKTATGTMAALKKMGEWNRLPANLKHLIAIDAATEAARRAKAAIDSWNQRHAKTITMKTVYESYSSHGVSHSSNSMISPNATGTQNFQGGLAMINDAPGSRYQEMVTLPNGMQFMAAGRNAILPLPQHTKVETAMRTATKYPIPRFASGTTDYTGATTQINRMQTVTVAAPVQSDSGVGDTLQTLNALVAALLNSKQEFTGQVVLDNKTAVGTWIAETVRKEIQKHDKIVNRQKGVLA